MGSEFHSVKLSWQCLLKIVQHSRDFSPEFVTGQLLGMDTDASLEVTDCFPFASNLTDELEQEEYQIETMKSLRECNVDTNTVGWYQTCSFDAFVSSSLTEAQLVYQSTIPKSIVLIVDVSKAGLASPVVRAFQVRPNYQASLLRECSNSQVDKFGLIFKEVPVTYSLSSLDKWFLAQEHAEGRIPKGTKISSPNEETKILKSFASTLMECVDDSISEVGKLQYSLRNIMKHSQSSSNRNKRKEDVVADYLTALKNGNEGTLLAFCHTSAQIEQFEKFVARYREICEEKLKFN